jgi:hypothetical protein
MKGVGAAHELRTHKGALAVEYAGVHILQGITSQVIVTVAGGGCKVDVADTVVLHSLDDLHLIVFRHRINGLKAFLQRLFRFCRKFPDFPSDAKAFVHLVHFIYIHWFLILRFPVCYCSTIPCFAQSSNIRSRTFETSPPNSGRFKKRTSLSRLNQVSWRFAKCLVSRFSIYTASSRLHLPSR